MLGGRRNRALGLSVSFGLLSCGARTALVLDEPPTGPTAAVAGGPNLPKTCSSGSQCITRDAADPCGPRQVVAPQCDPTTLQWHCPDGAWPYERATSDTECLPLHAGSLKIDKLSGSLSRVPTADGRCIWIAEELRLSSGATLRNVGFEPDPRAPFGACPNEVKFLGGHGPESSVFFADGTAIDSSSQYVQITGGFRGGAAPGVSAAPAISYRLYRVDPNATFGLAELGTGLGYWDAASERILVPKQPRFGADLDYGNASWSEGAYSYLWGCNAVGHYLTEGCLLGRRDAQDRVELYIGPNSWSATAGASAGVVVFDDGPWLSSVERSNLTGSDYLLHVFASAFSDHLQIQRADRPEGPWDDAATLAPCTRPASDAKAYCAGPILHAELADPTRPGELVVSYGLATTGPGTGSQQDYWSRLAWVRE
jgi:hypothetical protein